MRTWRSCCLAMLLTILPTALPGTAQADEGMWTFDNFPSAALAAQHGARIDQPWLDRVRLATVRLANCTASFVSNEGLILTNHHCIESCLAENSSRDRSLVDEGHLARTGEQELRCGTQVADVLIEMENITARVEAATRNLGSAAANDARKRTLTQLESACEASAAKSRRPLKCESVTLYDGGQYFLYKYRRYTDVRLVFAPEAGIAAFGGDPDNFQFPRYCLDMALLRAYDGDRPVKVAAPLRVNFSGPARDELVLVSGHPGSTDRLLTVAQLRQARDVELPPTLLRASELRGRYIQFASQSDEARRMTQSPLSSLENGLKVRRKLLDALLDETLLTEKAAAEQALRARVASMPDAAQIGDPWVAIAAASETARTLDQPHSFIEAGAGFNSRLFRYARALVRGAEERGKPNEDRLREFTEAALPRIVQQLGAPVAIYPEVEALTLAFGFERMREWLGPDHPIVRQLLATESPEALAKRLVAATTLAEAEARLALWNGGAAAIAASKDPLILLAKSVDAEARALRKRYETEVEAPTRIASEKIAAARFAAFGTAIYPDATFTLRLNYGTVQGWNENGVDVQPFTELGTAFDRATGSAPFRIPDSWLKVRDRLDMQTPFNLSTNNDIVGGNSGSPLINASGEIVGLIFDGNIHSISGSYWFDTRKNRSIAVHPAIMREALLKVYNAPDLLEELTRARR